MPPSTSFREDAFCALPATAAPTNMQPGLWEITMKMKMAGKRIGDCK